MTVSRMSAVWLGSLLMIATTMARTGPDGATPPAADPGLEPPAAANPAPAKPEGGGVIRGSGGVGFNPPQKQEQLYAIKQILEAGDDEWKTISPKVAKVLVAKQNLSTGAGMNWTASNDAKPVFVASGAKPDTAPGKAMQTVRAAVADKNASKEDFARKMAAVREARKQARADYEAAQVELIDALSPRQQAILMTCGVVE